MNIRAERPKVIACVIVRMKSTRLPRKALADVSGEPLLARLIRRLRQAHRVDQIVICTSTHPDDAVLCDLADELGVPCLRGNEDDVLERIERAASRFDADLVLRVTGDNIFTDPEYIDRMVERHVESGAEYTRTHGLPLGVTAEVLSTSMLPRLREAIPDAASSEYMIFYAFDPERFRCTVLQADEEVRRPYYSVTVDTPADLRLVRAFYAAYPGEEQEPDLRTLVRWLDTSDEYSGISPEAPVRVSESSSITYEAFLEMMERRSTRADQDAPRSDN